MIVEFRGLFDLFLKSGFFEFLDCLDDLRRMALFFKFEGSDFDFEIPEFKRLANRCSSSSALLLLSSSLASAVCLVCFLEVRPPSVSTFPHLSTLPFVDEFEEPDDLAVVVGRGR